MAWKMVWPGSSKWFRWAMWGVKPKMNRVVSKPVSNIARPTTTPNTKPIQVKKPMKKF